jgi:Phage integrase family
MPTATLTPTGTPINSRSDWSDWHDLLRVAGVREARVHDARHTAATLLLEQGVGIRVVQQILGHSQVSQTERYTHVTTQLGRDAAERMSGALWSPAAQLQPELQPEIDSRPTNGSQETRETPGQNDDDHEWGGWGSNPRPADYESAALTG